MGFYAYGSIAVLAVCGKDCKVLPVIRKTVCRSAHLCRIRDGIVDVPVSYPKPLGLGYGDSHSLIFA